ncbi:MAG TPA: DNA-binding protein [Verrucomicrobiales bacterium]|nr:DNA-binding protein [Verrucomicrobiales bacterium]
MKPSTREWIKKAEADYQLALILSRRRKMTFHDQGCFLCQQSAEKYLKARLEEANIMSPKTHDLKKLLNLLLPVEPLWAAMLPALAGLTDYAVEFRYPGHEATARQMKEAIKAAKAVRKEARLALGLKV